jgi:hypothetical protein
MRKLETELCQSFLCTHIQPLSQSNLRRTLNPYSVNLKLGHHTLQWIIMSSFAKYSTWNFSILTYNKHSHYRPWQALRVSARWGSQISRELEHESGKVVSPMYRPPLPPRNYSWYSFLFNPRATLCPEGLCQWKIPVTPSGIKPATSQHSTLTNCATAYPPL